MPWITPDAHAQAVEAAREIVLRRLDRSAAPRAALADLLGRKEVDPRVAAEVLDRLEAAGVIDDAAYAARLARTRFVEKGAARRAIAEELRRKGLGGGTSPQPSTRSTPMMRTRRPWRWLARSFPPRATCPGRFAGVAPRPCWAARATAGKPLCVPLRRPSPRSRIEKWSRHQVLKGLRLSRRPTRLAP